MPTGAPHRPDVSVSSFLNNPEPGRGFSSSRSAAAGADVTSHGMEFHSLRPVSIPSALKEFLGQRGCRGTQLFLGCNETAEETSPCDSTRRRYQRYMQLFLIGHSNDSKQHLGEAMEMLKQQAPPGSLTQRCLQLLGQQRQSREAGEVWQSRSG